MPAQRSPLILFVLAAWALAVALVGIEGDFPLSDDWAYAYVVRGLLDGRGFEFLPWTGASVVVQALYAAAACTVTGYSHEVLRMTTLAISVSGVTAFDALLRETGATPRVAAAGAAALAFSPLWFSLSFTFMTDVPFAALSLLAAALYAGALRIGSRRALVQASLFAAAAVLVRQHAVWIAVAAAAAALVPRSGTDDAPLASGSSRRGDALAALALPALTVTAWLAWATFSLDAPLGAQNKIAEAGSVSVASLASVAFRAAATLGLLFVPWAVTMPFRSRAEALAFGEGFALLTAAASFLYVREGATMFYLTNVLGDYTAGALTTRDVLFLGLPYRPTGGPLFHGVVTAAALAGAARLAAAMTVPAPERAGGGSVARFLALALLFSAAGTLVQSHYYFDRYVLVLVPLAVAATAARVPEIRLGPSFAVLLALFGWWSVAGTHDYMAWNRARWELLAMLESRGVPPTAIDGGVEYNAQRLAAALRTAPTDEEARSGQSADRRSWWWVVDDEWVIAFAPLDGYVEEDTRTFERWLPPGEGRVLALHRRARRDQTLPRSDEVMFGHDTADARM